jgi:hypothetical protein
LRNPPKCLKIFLMLSTTNSLRFCVLCLILRPRLGIRYLALFLWAIQCSRKCIPISLQ